METRTLVDPFSFNEHALDRVDRLFAAVASNGVDHLNHRAIQSSQQTIARILGKFDAAHRSKFPKRVVSGTNLFDTRTSGP